MNKKYYIYKITNLVNGKIYIGKHSQKIQNKDTYFGSGVLLNKAINKYGKENFKKGCKLSGWEIKEIKVNLTFETRKARLQHRLNLKEANLLTKRQQTISKFDIGVTDA